MNEQKNKRKSVVSIVVFFNSNFPDYIDDDSNEETSKIRRTTTNI